MNVHPYSWTPAENFPKGQRGRGVEWSGEWGGVAD